MLQRKTVVLWILLLVALGCGGGGGGGAASTATLLYSTDWTRSGAAGGGVSQRVSVLGVDGQVLRTLIANKSVSGVQTYRLDNLPAGPSVLVCELYSQASLGGIKVGEFRTALTLAGEATFHSLVGEPVDSIKVSPESATITVPRSLAFYVMPRSVGGVATFAAASQTTWSVLGSIGTVTSQGRFLSATAGSGAVRATHTPTGSLSSATVDVDPPVITQGKWTILVFLNAANDLYSFSTLNMNQIEKVAGNSDVRFVLQWKQSQSRFSASSFDGTRRYLAKPDTNATIASELIQDLGSGVDMGRPQTMKDFIDWAKTYYPADRYGVVVWNHGNGWRRKPQKETRAVSYDDETGNAIQIWELQASLGAHHFDFIAWDASLMQMLEVAHEVRSKADFVVGSEESPPAEGYPYDAIFAKFRDNPNDTTRNLTKHFVDEMLAAPGYASRKITQSVLDTTKVSALSAAVSNLATALMANSGSLTTVIPQVRGLAQSYSQASVPPRYYRDLVDACLLLEGRTAIPAVLTASQNVRAAVAQALVWEGHNSNSPGSHGVSIDFTAGNIFISSATDYGRMEFGAQTNWDEWLVTAP